MKPKKWTSDIILYIFARWETEIRNILVNILSIHNKDIVLGVLLSGSPCLYETCLHGSWGRHIGSTNSSLVSTYPRLGCRKFLEFSYVRPTGCLYQCPLVCNTTVGVSCTAPTAVCVSVLNKRTRPRYKHSGCFLQICTGQNILSYLWSHRDPGKYNPVIVFVLLISPDKGPVMALYICTNMYSGPSYCTAHDVTD